MAGLAAGWTQAEIDEIQQHLTRILASPVFAHTHRQSRFLNYIVQETLAGRADRLNQRVIGIEVFDRSESFDTAVDSIVRVEAGRLRSKLRDYYDELGKSDPVYIDLPKRSYAVRIRMAPGVGAKRRKWHASVRRLETTAVEDMVVSTEAVRPTIAVLPFDNVSSDREQECFADGITVDLITDLARLSGISVIARQSVSAYKGAAVRAQRISEELGAEFILQGSVRRVGKRFRINAQLIDGSSGKHVWAHRYDREMEDIFELQDDVNRKIVEALKARLSTGERARSGRKRTDGIEACDCMLRGPNEAR